MRIASLVRSGLRLGSSRRCAARQCMGQVQYVQSPIGSSLWERPFHSGFSGFLPPPVFHYRMQQPRQDTWYARGQKSRASGTAGVVASELKASPKANAQQPVVYRGPLSDTLRKVKALSLTSCCLSVITGPAIVFLTSPHLSVILKGGVAAAVMILSASTTAALHWFVGPYVHKMTWIPGSNKIEVETMTWMATYTSQTISVEDIRPPRTNRPFVTFTVKGKFFFVDPEKITNKDLLRIVTFYQKKQNVRDK